MSAPDDLRCRIGDLLKEHGQTFADEAGVRLRDTPGPLYQLLVVCVVSSIRIRANIAVAAARELFAAGYRSPTRMLNATWQQRVDALGRAHYKRYDESTATALGDGAQLILDRWHGDLRKLRAEAGHDPRRIREMLQEVPRIGPVGAEIFCREAQSLWPELRPTFDQRAIRGAAKAGLPTDPHELAALVSEQDLPRLAAALVRATL
ncbi:MAG TPA: endonuclease [Actinocrinis sp.]|nr:endonuclease [Actinocrinis sp.]